MIKPIWLLYIGRQGQIRMRVAHILRKYNPAQWGGTETAVQRLLDGLASHGVSSIVYGPNLDEPCTHDPFAEAGHSVRTYRARAPVWGISEEQRKQLFAVGGNLLSFDLVWKLLREPDLAVIHTHATNRLGGAALTVARWRGLPLVATIHGGVLDLPDSVRQQLAAPLQGGWEWGKVFGALLRSRRVLEEASAIFTCNRNEAELLAARFPGKRIVVQPHGVPASLYQADQRSIARAAFPQIQDRPVLLAVGRIDPVKNQSWLVQQWPAVLQRHPEAMLALAGACTDESYGKQLKKDLRNLGIEKRVLLTGGLPPGDARLVGLLQTARALVLPSQSETFGLVIIEAWAAGTPVLSSRTSGADELVQHGHNGLLFDLTKPETFHEGLDLFFSSQSIARQMAEAGRQRVHSQFDTVALAARIKALYSELIEDKTR
jgi:alpha-maltose-1-phosphate synthase